MLADELKEKAERELKGKENIKYELKGYMNHDDAMEYISDNSFDFHFECVILGGLARNDDGVYGKRYAGYGN